MNKKKKQTIAAIAATALLVSGTYAWQAFDQIVRNESAGFDADQGSRLHNDFNGTNADVYVENFASEEGAMLYTRLRLHEYMEIGTGAGTGAATIVRGDELVSTTPEFSDKDTWDIYLDQGNDRDEEDIRTYLEVNYGDIGNANGGATVYMPTFNKNFDDLTADINGSLLGLGGSKYDDYTTYSIGESITDVAIYSKDALAAQEQTPNAEGVVELTETHVAQSTLEGYVTTMDEWNDGGQQKGNFWVFDTDGWAYWANGLAPQTATSLLVDNISKVRTPDADYYYALHVVNQTATADGWEEGIYTVGDTELTDAATELMKEVAGVYPPYVIDSVALSSLSRTYTNPGSSVTLTATVTTEETDDDAKRVNWTVTEKTGYSVESISDSMTQGELNDTVVDGVFTPVATMSGKTYEITATSAYNAQIRDSVTITVDLAISIPGTTGTVVVGSTTSTITVNSEDFYAIDYTTVSGKEVVKLLLKTSTGTGSEFNGTDDGNAYSGSQVETAVTSWYTTWVAKIGVSASDVVTGSDLSSLSSGTPELSTLATSTRAFLLSQTEAIALSSTIRASDMTCWLRTPSSSSSKVAYYMQASGGVGSSAYPGTVTYSHGVRPALWIYL